MLHPNVMKTRLEILFLSANSIDLGSSSTRRSIESDIWYIVIEQLDGRATDEVAGH